MKENLEIEGTFIVPMQVFQRWAKSDPFILASLKNGLSNDSGQSPEALLNRFPKSGFLKALADNGCFDKRKFAIHDHSRLFFAFNLREIIRYCRRIL